MLTENGTLLAGPTFRMKGSLHQGNASFMARPLDWMQMRSMAEASGPTR